MNHSSPFFSVIMPAFNASEYIEEAILSIQAQTFKNFELIIIDDGSSDATLRIISDYVQKDERILGLHQTNRGAAAARNHGIAHAQAKWVCYLDSDDIWFPETLEKYANYISVHPKAKFIYGYRHRLRDGKITLLKGTHQDSSTSSRDLFLFPYLSPIRVCHQRDLVDEVGGYDENLPGACEDIDLFLRMGLRVVFEPIDFATGLRRRHKKNISRPTGYNYMIEAAMLKRFLEDLDGKKLLKKEEINGRLGRLYYAAGRDYFFSKYYRQSLQALEIAASYKMTLKGRLMKWAARFLIPFGVADKSPVPIRIPEPKWKISRVPISPK